MHRFFLHPRAVLVAAALAQFCLAANGAAQETGTQRVTLQPDPAPGVVSFYRDWTKGDEPALSREEAIERLRAAVKYVFVIFHENESFDHYFGTYPGANGLFEAPHGFVPANKTPSFTQRFLDTSLNVKTVSPFLMPQAVVGNGGQVVPIYPA